MVLDDTLESKVIQALSIKLQDEASLCLELLAPLGVALLLRFLFRDFLLRTLQILQGLHLPNPNVLVLTPACKVQDLISG